MPRLQQSFTVQDLGGWPQANADVIDGVWQRQVYPQLDVELLGPSSN
jgi:hypothetical protein